MRVAIVAMGGVVAVIIVRVYANQIELPETHAPLGADAVRECPDPAGLAFEHYRFQRVLVIERDSRGGHHQVVVVVL